LRSKRSRNRKKRGVIEKDYLSISLPCNFYKQIVTYDKYQNRRTDGQFLEEKRIFNRKILGEDLYMTEMNLEENHSKESFNNNSKL
jgi:hypothetical protein